jgi:hypothetical protein
MLSSQGTCFYLGEQETGARETVTFSSIRALSMSGQDQVAVPGYVSGSAGAFSDARGAANLGLKLEQ